MLLISQRTMNLAELSPTVSEISGQLLLYSLYSFYSTYSSGSSCLFYGFYVALQILPRRSRTAYHAPQPRFLT